MGLSGVRKRGRAGRQRRRRDPRRVNPSIPGSSRLRDMHRRIPVVIDSDHSIFRISSKTPTTNRRMSFTRPASTSTHSVNGGTLPRSTEHPLWRPTRLYRARFQIQLVLYASMPTVRTSSCPRESAEKCTSSPRAGLSRIRSHSDASARHGRMSCLPPSASSAPRRRIIVMLKQQRETSTSISNT